MQKWAKAFLYYSKSQEGKQKVKNNSTNNVKLFAYLVIKKYYLCSTFKMKVLSKINKNKKAEEVLLKLCLHTFRLFI